MKKRGERGKLFSFVGQENPFREREKVEIVRVGRQRRAVLNGVTRILQYDNACMAFLLGKDRVELHGNGLSCVSYISGAIGIVGEIDRILFLGEEKRQ